MPAEPSPPAAPAAPAPAPVAAPVASYLPADDPGLPVPRVPRSQVRRRLLDAAATVFAQRGYERSRLEDIARAAGFTKGAVYSNFASKHELFAELLTEHAKSTTVDIVDELPDGSELSTVSGRAAALMAHWLVHESGWHQLELEFASSAGRDAQVRQVYAPRRRAQRAELAALLEEQARRLGVRVSIDMDRAALILLALHNGLGLEHGADPESVTGREMRQALEAVLAGLIALPETAPPAAGPGASANTTAGNTTAGNDAADGGAGEARGCGA